MRTTAISSLVLGILTCTIMVQMCAPAVSRLLSVSLTDSILH